jgi:hypothetical protein
LNCELFRVNLRVFNPAIRGKLHFQPKLSR